MSTKYSIFLTSLVIILLALLILPATAAVNRIAPGGDVFIGEEGLDITGASGGATSIAWFASGTNPNTDIPNYIVAVGNPASFYASPAAFVGRTGNWYNWNGANQGIAFNVVDPTIDIKVWDQNANKDITGKQVVEGNFLNFRIETNTYTIVNRPGYAGEGFVTIKVKNSDGATFTALYQDTAIPVALTNLAVDSSLWYWVEPAGNPAIGWNTMATYGGNRIYDPGTYTVIAELTRNKIKDNYKAPDGTDYTGRTVTAQKTIAITSDTVKIEASKDTVVRGNQFSVTVTGRANEFYYVWIKGTGSMTGSAGDQPPLMTPYQENVANDPIQGPYTIGSYIFEGGAGKPLKEDVPPAPDNGVQYYARIRTSASGNRTIGFLTGAETDEKTYTVRAENNFGLQYKSDEVEVTIISDMPDEEPPVADFIANSTSGSNPLTVQFTDLSENNPYAWLWDFGDGTTSNSKNPVHTYVIPGNHSVGLTVMGAGGNDTLIRQNYIIVSPQVNPPESISNLRNTTYLPDSITWVWTDPATADFGSVMIYLDNASPVEVLKGVQEFTAGGLSPDTRYTLCISTVGITGIINQTRLCSDSMTAPHPPVADFVANITTGIAPLAVAYDDLSQFDPVSWYWEFGDGHTSSIQDPVHIYMNPGAYTVKLTVTNPGGSDALTRTEYIRVKSINAKFTASPCTGNMPLLVRFTDQSTGVITSYAWDFNNDGRVDSRLKNPTHLYRSPGFYTVRLSIRSQGAADEVIKEGYIHVQGLQKPPVARFSMDKHFGSAPLSIQFTDLTINNPDTLLWNFGDGSTSTMKNPAHTFTLPGIYKVRLLASNEAGSSSVLGYIYVR